MAEAEGTTKSMAIGADADFPSLSEEQKIKVFKEWRRMSDSASSAWLTQANRSYEYIESNQVPDALKESVKDGKMLWLCLNILRYRIAGKVALLTAEKPTPYIEGMELADQTGAEALNKLFRFTSEQSTSRIYAKNKQCVKDEFVCGLGAIAEFYNEDIDIDLGGGEKIPGDVACRRVNPTNLRLDPTMEMCDIDTMDYIIEIQRPKLRSLRAKYGDLVKDIKGSDSARGDSGGRLRDYDVGKAGADAPLTDGGTADDAAGLEFNKVAELELIHYRLPEVIEKVYRRGEQNELTAVDTPSSEIPPEEKKNHKIIKRLKYTVYRALKCEDKLLDDGECEFSEIPYALYFGDEVHDFFLPVGDVYHLLHPTDLMNGLISAIMDNAIRTNNAGVYWERGTFSPTEKLAVQKNIGSPGFTFETEPGMLDKVKHWQPNELSTALYTLWSDFRVMFDELDGSRQVQRGGMPYDTSGRGIIALQRSADLATSSWHISMEDALTRWGRLRMENIQKRYVYERALRITSDMAEGETMHITFKDGAVAVLSAKGEVLLKDLSAAKFDVRITVRKALELSAEERRAQGQFLYEAGAVDLEYLVGPDSLDVRNGKEVLARRQKEDQIRQLGVMAAQVGQKYPEVLEMLKNPGLFEEIMRSASFGEKMRGLVGQTMPLPGPQQNGTVPPSASLPQPGNTQTGVQVQ